LDQEAHDLLAFGGRRAGRLPHRREVGAERHDIRPLGRRQGEGGLGFPSAEFLFRLFHGAQLGFPLVFQTPGDQPVFRLDGIVLPLRALTVIAQPLQVQRPLPL